VAVSFHQYSGVNWPLSGDDFFADEMQADYFGRLTFFKVAFHRVANLDAQRLDGFRFGKDGMTQGAGGVSTFRRFFDEKNEFVHSSFGPMALNVAMNFGNLPLFFKETLREFY
jgi:hypothetical protein